jgi:hypothetical protein
MYPTNRFHPLLRYPLAALAAILSALMFLGLMIGALKLGEWVMR